VGVCLLAGKELITNESPVVNSSTLNTIDPQPNQPTTTTTTTAQEGSGDHKGAWRSRQNASLLLGLMNAFFKGGLMAHLEHGLQDRDLAVPLHIDACLKLLASNTTALNSSFTPF